MGFKYLTFGSAFTITFFENNTTNPITYDPSDGYIAKNFKSFKNNGVEHFQSSESVKVLSRAMG